MTRPGLFIHSDTEYMLAVAELDALVPDAPPPDTHSDGQGKSLCWCLRFESIEMETDGESGSTIVEFDALTFPNVADWHGLLGTSLSWSQPINAETGEPYGYVHDFECWSITKGNLEFRGRDGAEFHVIASGETELGDTFQIEAPVTFSGIRVRGSGQDDEHTLSTRLSQHFSTANLQAAEVSYHDPFQSGEKLAEALFRPVT